MPFQARAELKAERVSNHLWVRLPVHAKLESDGTGTADRPCNLRTKVNQTGLEVNTVLDRKSANAQLAQSAFR